MSSNLLGLNRAQFQAWCEERGEKPFRARQMMRWMHQSGINDFALMSDVSRDFREKLATCAVIEAPQVLRAHKAVAMAVRRGASAEDIRAVEAAHLVRTWVHPDHWRAADGILKPAKSG